MAVNTTVKLMYGIILVKLLLGEALAVHGLLPACGPTDGLLGPCYRSISGDNPQPVSMDSECCMSIRLFRFPGCLCVALRWEMGRTIDQAGAQAALSLPARCGRPLPRGFNCTGL